MHFAIFGTMCPLANAFCCLVILPTLHALRKQTKSTTVCSDLDSSTGITVDLKMFLKSSNVK